MCVGIPMEVLEVRGNVATCRGRQGVATVDASLVAPLAPGEWVMTFLGAARSKVLAEEAVLIDRALDALDSIARGEAPDVAAFFPDLVDREPELPEHLRAQVANARSDA